MPMTESAFQEIKEQSAEKWRDIQVELQRLLGSMLEACAFCEEYNPDDKHADDCECPAQKTCLFALDIIANGKVLLKNTRKVIKRIERIKQKKA